MNDKKVEEKYILPFIKKTIIKRDNLTPYLIRYSLKIPKWLGFEVKVHHILQSDDTCLHDHPWAFWSLILWGGYWEWQEYIVNSYDLATGKYSRELRKYREWYGPLSFLKRYEHTKHRLEIPKGRSCWTLVVTFKKTKSWGFWVKGKYVDYKNYNTKMCE